MADLDSTPVRPCVKCGFFERFACGGCKYCAKQRAIANKDKIKIRKQEHRIANIERIKARDAAYAAANKEKKSATGLAYRTNNKELLKQKNKSNYDKSAEVQKAAKRIKYTENSEAFILRSKTYRAENKDKVRDSQLKWHQKNPDARRTYHGNRRARLKNQTGKLSVGLAKSLFALQRGKCACCGKSLDDGYHLDHIMPLALGGENIDSNMQLLTQRCNNQKYSKHPVDFMQERGFLL